MSDNEFTIIPGQNNVILIAPHGFMGKPKDDERTAEIAEHIQKGLNCYAVINKTYRKARDGEDDFDRDKKICNLNHMSHYKKPAPDVYDAFVGPIKRFKDEIKSRKQIPYIFHIHGASTVDFDAACKQADAIKHQGIQILIGTGRGTSANDPEESLTAPPQDVDSLIACLKEEQFVAYSTNHWRYAAKEGFNLNQLFRESNYPDNDVLSFQLEIRKKNLRDKPDTAVNTARRLTAAIGKFTGVAIQGQAEVVTEESIRNDGQDKIEEAVQHILSECKVAYVETMSRMVNIGNYLVKNFFGGNFEMAGNPRNINTDKSLRQIQEKLKGPLGRASKTWVYDALKVSVDYHSLKGTDVFQTYGNLSNSHKVKLAYAPEEHKKELITGCEAENWSVRKLNEEIKNRKPPRKKSPAKTLLSLVGKPEKLIAEDFEEKFKDLFNELSSEQRAAIEETVSAAVDKHQLYLNQYQSLLDQLGKLKKKVKKRSKFNDWVCETVSCQTGCSNDCLYCFAKGDAINKGRIAIVDWPKEQLSKTGVKEKYKLFDKPVMCPGTHDITEENFDNTSMMLLRLLEAGNRVLIVSKPRTKLIEKLCKLLKKYRNKILFRFTIGAMDDKILSFWEPNAPTYNDRKEALRYAFEKGFRTSISIEPMLDPENVTSLVNDLASFVNHSIWIGTMNTTWYMDTDPSVAKTDAGKERANNNLKYYGEEKAEKMRGEISRIKNLQQPDSLNKIYESLKDNPIVQWKWHIKDALGMPLPTESEKWPEEPLEKGKELALEK